MIIKNPITGEYIKQTLTDEGLIFTKPSEQELNAHLQKPTFTTVSTEPLVEDNIINPSLLGEDDPSFFSDVGRIGFGTLEGIAELGSDVFVRPFVKDKEEYDESYIEWRGNMAEYVPGLEREDIIDSETGKVLAPETGFGMALDVASYLVGGGVVFKALGKINKLRKSKYGTVTRGVIAEQAVEQVLADPDVNLANIVNEEFLDESSEVLEFLAADEADDKLFNRAKMAVVSGTLTAGIGGLLKLGFKAIDITKHSKAVLGGKARPSTQAEYEEVVGSLLNATKEQLKNNPSSVVTSAKEVAEDTAEGVAQIINQSSGEFFKPRTWVPNVSTLVPWSHGARTWVKQRYFSSRGFLSEEGRRAKEESVEAQKRLISHAGHLAKRLQRFMDNTIEEDDTRSIVENVNRALTDKKMYDLSPEEKIKYLTETDMVSFLKQAYNFSDEVAATLLKQKDKVKFLEGSGYSKEEASEIAKTKLYGFSSEVAEDIADARGTIDTLSKTILDSNIGSEAVRAAISANMGSYMRQSYKLYEDADWRPSDSVIEEAKEAIFRDKLGTKQVVDETTGKKKSVAATPEDFDEKTLQEFRGEASNYVKDLLDKNDLSAYDDYLTQIKKVNQKYLKQRKEMLPELEKLLGKIESPTENIILTIQKSASLVENNKFYTRLMELGGSVPSRPEVYDRAWVQARTELSGTQFNLLDEEGIPGSIKKGSYVTINNSNLGIPVGTLVRVVKIGDRRTPNKTQIRRPGFKKLISIDTKDNPNNLTLVPKDKELEKIAKQFYDDATGGEAYTTAKYISRYGVEEGDGPFTTKITGTGSALDGQYTTKDLARVIHNLEDTHMSLFGFGQEYFKKGAKSQGIFQWFAGAKGLNQQMRTVYDHTTHLRNALGGLQFGTANGLNPLKNGKLNFQVLRNEIGEGGNKVFDEYYELLQGLGVIGTSVRASEARALLDIASETTPSRWMAKIEDYAKRHPDTPRGKIAQMVETGKRRPEQLYMATDDFFKMNSFANELDTLRKAHKNDASMTEDLLRIEAANIIKDTMPNYNRVAMGIKALREMPVGNFVAFPAEIARTSANIITQSFKEIKSGNSVLRNRGLQRLAGFSFTNLGWYTAGSFGYKMSGFTKDENEGLQTNAEGFTVDHNKHFIKGEDGDMYVHDPTYINSYYVWQEIGQKLYANIVQGNESGEDFAMSMANGVLESTKAFVQPFTDKSMFTELLTDLSYASNDEQGRTPKGRMVFSDKENFGDSVIDAMEYIAEGFMPGFILDANKYAKALFQEPNPSTGLKDSLTSRTIEMLSGINYRKYKPEDNFMFHVKKFSSIVNYGIPRITPRYGKTGDDYFQEYSIGQAKRFKAFQELYRQIEAMRKLGYTSREIYHIAKKKGIRSKKVLRNLMTGSFSPDTISLEKRKDMFSKAGDSESEQTLALEADAHLQRYYRYLNGLRLHPGDVEEDRDAVQSALRKMSLSEFKRLEFKKGGEVNIPQAPKEPDERIDKMTGLPYHIQAGGAFIDDEDPLKRLGFTGGGQVDPLVRLGFSSGGGVSIDVTKFGEWLADKLFGMDRNYLEKNETDAEKIVKEAVDRKLLPQEEAEGLKTIDKRTGMPKKKEYGDGFNAINHMLLAAKNPGLVKAALQQIKEVAQGGQALVKGNPEKVDDSIIDWENNKVGFKIGIESGGDFQKIKEGILDKLAARQHYLKSLKVGPDPYAIPEKRIFEGPLPVLTLEDRDLYSSHKRTEESPSGPLTHHPMLPATTAVPEGESEYNWNPNILRESSVLGGLKRSRRYARGGKVLGALSKVAVNPSQRRVANVI